MFLSVYNRQLPSYYFPWGLVVLGKIVSRRSFEVALVMLVVVVIEGIKEFAVNVIILMGKGQETLGVLGALEIVVAVGLG